jgi:RecG-like helicase
MTTLLAAPQMTGLRPQEHVSVAGTISKAETVSAGLSPVYRCVLSYDGGELDLLFLGRAVIAGLTAGTRCTAAGTVAVHRGRLAVWNPRYQVRP